MLKLLTLLFLLPVSVKAQIPQVTEGDAIKAEKINEIIMTVNKIYDVGDVRTSLLTEASFQSRNGTCWVLMKGQNVSTSVYAQVSGKNTLPNAEGRFLRNIGGNAPALGETQQQEMLSHTHLQNAHTHGQDAHNHIGGHARAVGYAYNDQAPWGTWQPGAGRVSAEAGGNYNRGFAYTSPSTPAIHNTAAVNQNYGGAETRPDNLGVNLFIKINNCN